jgi:cytochrome c oxidase subunit 2
MAIAIALIVIVLGSIIFHFWSPWTMTPLASNWGSIDDTMLITLIITGIVFIAINFFIAFAVISFRHKAGRKAKYEPENKKLELWLTIATSIGIVAMLAPGLVVYADFVNVPDDALEVEVVGQQWSWSFRFPGKDNKLGKSAVEHISIDNPFGLDPLDSAGQDDRLVLANRVSFPLDKPIKVLLRSKDVLHDFYVPQFRVKMDMVPGTVTYLWFTPTVLGEFEILCAEFCGLGHFNMRGKVDVLPPQDFAKWLSEQPTFATSLQKNRSEELSVIAQNGKEVAQAKGCLACHNFSDSAIGPTWLNLYGKTQTLVDGSQVEVDDEYLTEAILQPTAKVVKGFAPIMPAMPLTDLEVSAVIAYIKEKGQEQSRGNENISSATQLIQAKGCMACHSIDGSKMLGPTWQGLYGQSRTLNSGQTVMVDEDYLRESIFQPNAKIVAGYPAVMPPPVLNQQEAQAIIDLIKTL